MVRFIWRLSKVAVVMTESVSLRHSSAATIKQSAKAVKAMDVPTAALWKCLGPDLDHGEQADGDDEAGQADGGHQARGEHRLRRGAWARGT